MPGFHRPGQQSAHGKQVILRQSQEEQLRLQEIDSSLSNSPNPLTVLALLLCAYNNVAAAFQIPGYGQDLAFRDSSRNCANMCSIPLIAKQEESSDSNPGDREKIIIRNLPLTHPKVRWQSASGIESAAKSLLHDVSDFALIENLLAQDAPQAASLLLQKDAVLQKQLEENLSMAPPGVLALWRQIKEEALKDDGCLVEVDEEAFAVTRDHIQIVTNDTSASAFAQAMSGVVSRMGIVAIDAEWHPNTLLLSLLQVACDLGHVWLIDLQKLVSTPSLSVVAQKVDEALEMVFSSPKVRILGFRLNGDLEKLYKLPGWQCHQILSRVIDLYDSCDFANQQSSPDRIEPGPKSEVGLSSQVKRWTRFRLNKGMQCSDWSSRPLSEAQISYAAADAACLFELHQALANCCPEAIIEKDVVAPPTRLSARDAIPLLDPSEIGAVPISTETSFPLVSKAVERCDALGRQYCRMVSVREFDEDDRLELNALCLIVDPVQQHQQPKRSLAAHGEEHLVILTLASTTVDLKWLSNWLGIARKRLRMASYDECFDFFGAYPGTVPPLPLRPKVRLLALPNLALGGLRVWASAGHPSWRLLIDEPGQALPLLSSLRPRSAEQVELDRKEFEWLPDPSRRFQYLDDALMQYARSEDAKHKLIVDNQLNVLARRLRLIGVDCEIAGERLETEKEGVRGLTRTTVDVDLQLAALRRAAASDRLIIAQPGRSSASTPGVRYRLHSKDSDSQFSELVEVLHLQRLVHAGRSRCGICNANKWQFLTPSEVIGRVPPKVVELHSEFYQCTYCKQMFWAGDKYNRHMDSLKAKVS